MLPAAPPRLSTMIALAELLRERFRYRARHDVGAARRRIGHDHADRLGRIVLRLRRPRENDATTSIGKSSNTSRSDGSLSAVRAIGAPAIRLWSVGVGVREAACCRHFERRQQRVPSALRGGRFVFVQMTHRQRQRIAAERVAELARDHHFQHRGLALRLRLAAARRAGRRRSSFRCARLPRPCALATAAHDGCLSRFTPTKRWS